MVSIQNEIIKADIDPKGAELKSIFHKDFAQEYMWEGDPAFWGKTSPVLFPIVGTLKGNRYRFEGAEYELPRHGFARDQVFDVAEQTDDSVFFAFESNAETQKLYPFIFRFSISYRLQGNVLAVSYGVTNKGRGAMYFSVGGHPAFRVPLVDGTSYDDYFLRFEKEETAGRWPITKDGLIGKEPQPLLQGKRELPLTRELFSKDAVVLKGLRSASVELRSDRTHRGLRFHFPGYPYLGLWAAPGADFVCIEPWCGIADSVDADGELGHKEGIRSLGEGESFEVAWQAEFL